MNSESRRVSIIFTGAKIAGALFAFICAMGLGASWEVEIAAFFNVVQLIVLVYAVVVLVLRIANVPDSNFWKVETIASMVLGSLETAAASLWQATRDAVGFPKSTYEYMNTTISNSTTINIQRSSTNNDDIAVMFMIVFAYITGIICLSHAVYVVMKN